jgi:spermidine synthase
VRVHSVDGRLFLKTTEEKFDVIIVNLPDPQTAQLNRFYTAEFFREAAEKLNSGGVLSFQLRAAEDYISPELSEFLRCINRTLSEVFPEVRAVPGETVHFFATRQPGVLATGPDELIARLRARKLHASYVREYYIPFRMMPDRMLDLEQQIRSRAGTPVNHDFAPIAYYFDVVLWSTRFNVVYRALFQSVARVSFREVAGLVAVLLLAAVAAARMLRANRRHRTAAGVCVGVMGFTLMALEVLLLLAFQAIYGYVYHQLAIIIAAFMAGMALGSWWSLRRAASQEDMRTLAWLQGLAAALPLSCYGLFVWFSHFNSGLSLLVVSKLVFPALAGSCGLVGGYQFPIASRVFFKESSDAGGVGTVYALDLVGACAGALLPSIYLIPVFGLLRTALLIALVDLVVALQAALSAWETQSRPLPAAH